MSYSSGEAAEQVVRMTLNGVEVAAKISGKAAERLAVLLYAVLKDQKKTRGKTRLNSMLRSGKELKVFAIGDRDLEKFCREAKKYGILYCVLKDKTANDGHTDVFVRAEDASKINRIFERFGLATVDMGSVKTEIRQTREERPKSGEDIPAPERTAVEDKLEQFLEAGFSKETAVRMINSALIVRSDAQVFSTIDISSLDLYTGICEFLKVGASTTFIRRENWVETISSTSLPAGVFHKLEPDCTSRKLYDGDMVIMVTDGVLDALPGEDKEQAMCQFLESLDFMPPQEMAERILEFALSFVPGARDDMTVLTAGIWKKE